MKGGDLHLQLRRALARLGIPRGLNVQAASKPGHDVVCHDLRRRIWHHSMILSADLDLSQNCKLIMDEMASNAGMHLVVDILKSKFLWLPQADVGGA